MKIVSAIGEYSIMILIGIKKFKSDFGFSLQNRANLSTMLRHLVLLTKALARKQLSLRFGHFPIGPTAALDDFFKRWQSGQI